jgi:subfamily B ATP-binding cassette protein MsbA
VWPRRGEVLVALLIAGGLAAVTGGYPLTVKYAFDALGKPGTGALGWILGAILAITVTRSVFLYLHQVASARLVMRMVTDIQKHAFAHLLSADYARLSRDATGALVSRLTNDLSFIQQSAQVAIVSFIRNVLSITVLISVMLHLDRTMTLVVLAVSPIVILPIRNIGRRMRAVARRTQVELGSMTARLTETLSGSRLIKAFCLEDYACRRLNLNFEHVFLLRMKSVRARARVGPMLEALGGAAVAGAIALAYWRISSGSSTIGDFIAFMTSLFLASQSVRSLGAVSTATMEGLSAADRVYELLDEKPAVVEGSGSMPSPSPAIVGLEMKS